MNIIVTGASRGIGKAIVERCCEEGNHHIIAIARNTFLLEQLSKKCTSINPKARVIGLTFDLTSTNYQPLLQAINEEIAAVDILVNNAGLLINKPFITLTEEEVYRQFNSNVFSVFGLIKALLLHFNSPAHIVNIGSMGGFQGSTKFSGLSAYSASKAALASLTECLAVELADRQIKVNCLALGSVETEMFAKAFPQQNAKTTTTAIADFIVPFALYQHAFFNGKVLPVSISTP